jgi:hypothetical protein
MIICIISKAACGTAFVTHYRKLVHSCMFNGRFGACILFLLANIHEWSSYDRTWFSGPDKEILTHTNTHTYTHTRTHTHTHTHTQTKNVHTSATLLLVSTIHDNACSNRSTKCSKLIEY